MKLLRETNDKEFSFPKHKAKTTTPEKQSVVSSGCFSLNMKNTFLSKGLRVLMLWIQSKVDYILNLPQILSKDNSAPWL